jgi:hypothetical protein
MRTFSKILAVAAACAGLFVVAAPAQTGYTPAAQLCVNGKQTLCTLIPGNIGPDPMLDQKVAYNGIEGAKPTSPQTDVQTPFDNLSWQTFVALNWKADALNRPPADGLKGDGKRVWESYARVSQVFGNGPVQAHCNVPLGMQTFSIASNGQGQPVAQNEEYIQAATGDPAIDVNGNWTIYERRVNGIEIAYLKAPGGNKSWDLTTNNGQNAFVTAKQTVNFPATGSTPNGAIEIKAAWRILNPAHHASDAKRFYIVHAMLMVAPDLVASPRAGRPQPICMPVDMGLVAMHIIQKNPLTKNSLLPEWFWSTFEQVDNAPTAQNACDPSLPAACPLLGQTACPAQHLLGAPDYSYYDAKAPEMQTNQAPQLLLGGKAFLWSSKEPFASLYLRTAKSGQKIGTQVSRCFQIYALTAQLNTQWRSALHQVGSVFQNYMLVGTQWGANTTNTPDPKVAFGGVPNFLSNSVVETYLQTLADPKNPFGNGSCISCHKSATLNVGNNVSSNLSFLPNLAQPALLRRPPLPPHS